MKKLFYFAFILIYINCFSQEVFEYEFDENLIINVIEDSDEGEIPNGKFIKGTYGNEVIIYSKSEKGKEKLKNIDENGLTKLFEGIKDGMLKSSNGKLISENSFSINHVKIYSFKILLNINGQNKIVENYNFVYKESTYTIQFMNDEDNFESNKEFRRSIIDSIKFN